LESALDGTHLPADRAQTLHRDRPLWVRYDLEAVGRAVSRGDLAGRDPSLWRYRELLPYADRDAVVSLGETITPLIPCPRLGSRYGLSNLLIKDESRLPTGSFKSRGLALAVTMAKQFGLKRLAIPTAGNAGGAMAAYAARAGMEAFVFMPDDTSAINQYECHLSGAKTFLVPGLITECGKIVREGKDRLGWFDVSTLKEPYRIEGKKTMGLELAEQLGWDVPDVIFYPTGGGTGMIGMWKAFAELEAIGWLGKKRPRMVAVQAEGCAPIVKGFEDGVEHVPLWPNAHTVAAGIRVPVAIGDFLILRAVRESGGFAMAVSDEAILQARDEIGKREGILLCPEGAATWAAYKQSLADGRIKPTDRAVLYNCATGLKYPLPEVTRTLDRHQAIDYVKLAQT
jgi:threonine synthase